MNRRASQVQRLGVKVDGGGVVVARAGLVGGGLKGEDWLFDCYRIRHAESPKDLTPPARCGKGRATNE